MLSKARMLGAPIPSMRRNPPKPPPAVTEAQIREAATRAHTAAKVAELLGISPVTAQKYLRQFGVKPSAPLPPRSTKQRIRNTKAATVRRAKEEVDYSRPNGTLYTVAALDGIVDVRRAEFKRRALGLPVFMTLEQVRGLA